MGGVDEQRAEEVLREESVESSPKRLVTGFSQHHDAMALSQTSVPHWSAEPVVLPLATAVVIVIFGDEAERETQNLRDGSSDVRRVVLRASSAWLPDFDDRIAALVAEQHVGVRIVVVGPEQDVMRTAALLRSRGAIEEELILRATDVAKVYLPATGSRRVFCGYCHVIQEAAVAIGGIITCSGCGASLTIHYHYSRPHAAYLGIPNGGDLEA